MIADHFPSHLNPSEEDYEGYPHHLSLEEAQELADSYCVEKLTMAGAAEEASISLSSFKDFRRAHQLRKGKAVIVDETKSIEEGIEHFSEEAKRREIDRKARKKQRRERDKAARRWHRLEQNLEEAAELWQEEEYDPPKPTLSISSEPPEAGAVLLNAQDWHVGKRAKGADEGLEEYVQSLKDAFAGALETAMRMRRIDTLYFVTGGDLIHVDGPQGTTSGTPQDLVCSPSEAFKEAVELVVWCIDYARALGIDVHVLTIMGNHDRTLSSAAGVAVQQRFHAAEDVETGYPLQERVYATYEDHLILATHGDMKKRQWRKLPSIMMGEARDLLAKTTWQMVASGHRHFQSVDLEDKAGTVHAQGSSPSPTDQWHYQEGYSTSRRGMQMILLQPQSPSTSIIQEAVRP